TLKKAKNTLYSDDVKINYNRLLKHQTQIEEALRSMDIARRQIEEDEKKLDISRQLAEKTRDACSEAKQTLNQMDCAKAIREGDNALSEAENQRDKMKEEKDRLLDFQNRILALLQWLDKEGIEVSGKAILTALTRDDYSSAEKENRINEFLRFLKMQRDRIQSAITRIDDAIENNAREQSGCQKIIDDCQSRRTSFSEIPDYVLLKERINREFRKQGIDSEARFACEYVIGLRDEAWRDVIEGYLGRRRYTILVDPEYYDIADDIFNTIKKTDAHLFNTRLLMKKKTAVTEGSAAELVEIKNTVAKKYFDYQLGRFHAVELAEVKNHENAMSREGRISVAMDS
ncbi:MAG: hypothetical protein IJV04_03350, partial [Lachnospiraceae bacterium]|nr:hypothetical protein [Lachnospiraceae bacterium]